MGGRKVEGVPAVLLQDILASIPSNTVILKLDVQGYECKVREESKKYSLSLLFIFFFVDENWFLLDTAAFYSLGRWWEDYSCNLHRMGHGIQVIIEDN